MRHSNKSVGSPEWSEEVTIRKYSVEPHIIDFVNFKKWKDRSVLEIGCGIGTDTLEFLKCGAFVDAVDLSPESVNLAKGRCSKYIENGRLRLFCADAETWLPDRKYDLVYCFGVLHHTPNPSQIIEDAWVRLKPNGELRVMIYAKWSIKNLIGQQPEAQANCPLAKVYSMKEAKRLISHYGSFRIIEAKKTHIFPWKVKDYINYRYRMHWYYRIMPECFFRWLESKLGWHLLLTAVKVNLEVGG